MAAARSAAAVMFFGWDRRPNNAPFEASARSAMATGTVTVSAIGSRLQPPCILHGGTAPSIGCGGGLGSISIGGSLRHLYRSRIPGNASSVATTTINPKRRLRVSADAQAAASRVANLTEATDAAETASRNDADAAATADAASEAPESVHASAGASSSSILVGGLGGRTWEEKAQHARTLLAGLLALSRPHNFLPSVLLVVLGAFLASSSAGMIPDITTATATAAAATSAATTAAAATAAAAAATPALPALPALPPWLSPRVLLVAALSGSIALASMIANDVFDWQIGSDRVNSPSKPLVSGAVHPHDAELAAGCLYSLIVLAACQLEPAPLRMLVAGAAVATYVYTPFLKRITLVKNVVVAGIIASSLLAGALAAGASRPALYRTSGAFLFLFQALVYREVLMDVADVTGDASAGVPTLAVRLGKQRAVLVACGMLVMAHAAGAFLARHSPALVVVASICLLPLYTLTLPFLSNHQLSKHSVHSSFSHKHPHTSNTPVETRSPLNPRELRIEQPLMSPISTETTGSSGVEIHGGVFSAQGEMEEVELRKGLEDAKEQKQLSHVIDISMVFIGAALLAFSAATLGFVPIVA
ncbi:hypothetical protein CLOM_g14560 [Closterium sp. NIES-68]|nr:hypothetical protein CLOM_g14560 [Closterium sp. NIES-68]GJP59706.1 hypothetical protein CLOP_g15081 [Closterium sp. NIES-67]